MVGNPITLAPGTSTGHCLVSAAVSVVPLDPRSSRSFQQDWCDPASRIGGQGYLISRPLDVEALEQFLDVGDCRTVAN